MTAKIAIAIAIAIFFISLFRKPKGMLESSLWYLGVLQSARSVSSHRHFPFRVFPLTIYKADPRLVVSGGAGIW